MCGIAGFCNLKKNLETESPYWKNILRNMHRSVAHRGGDAAGSYLWAHAGLAHARLSIRDIEGGAQPMVRTVEGREFAIVYNGEIYNTDELEPELKEAGYHFETTSDTEVILYAFIHYGPSFVTKLNGIFAFAIWDNSREKLFLYRDRVGVKPLFYTEEPGQVVFGSEPKALFCHPDVTPELDTDGLREVLAIGPARTMGNGIFKGMQEVLPGHFLCFSRWRI